MGPLPELKLIRISLLFALETEGATPPRVVNEFSLSKVLDGLSCLPTRPMKYSFKINNELVGSGIFQISFGPGTIEIEKVVAD